MKFGVAINETSNDALALNISVVGIQIRSSWRPYRTLQRAKDIQLPATSITLLSCKLVCARARTDSER